MTDRPTNAPPAAGDSLAHRAAHRPGLGAGPVPASGPVPAAGPVPPAGAAGNGSGDREPGAEAGPAPTSPAGCVVSCAPSGAMAAVPHDPGPAPARPATPGWGGPLGANRPPAAPPTDTDTDNQAIRTMENFPASPASRGPANPDAVARPADRRLTPATARIALACMEGVLARPAYTPGTPVRLAAALADLCRAPGGARDRQVNHGADLILIDEDGPWAFVQSVADGYCGWIPADALDHETPAVTHRVGAPATHVYPAPDPKQREIASLSIGARLSVVEVEGRFARLAQGGWVPVAHITDRPATDPAEVALSLLGTPYLWGGNSRGGIDCSGLVQAALTACAVPCPGDSDMQRAAFAPICDQIRRGDLLFWPGHVAMALDAGTMIHATAFGMSVMVEPIAEAIGRIQAAGEGPFLGAHRPPPGGTAPFP